jgi:heme exporter protein B
VWNALFWIIILFAVVNAVSRSFYNENRSLQLYYYQLVSPAAVILSKILFNYLLVILLCLITLPVYTLFLGSPDADWLPFLLVVLLAAGAFSSAFTLISAIAAKGNNAAGLTPVLGFPVIIPLLLITIKASGNALDALDFSVYSDTVIVLVLFNVVLTAMAYLLFPYLWRE